MSSDPTYDAIERLRLPLYAFAFLLVAHPLGDFVANVWPLRFGSVEWRYGVMGLLSGFLLTPMFGLALTLLVASIVGDRRVTVTVGWTSIAAGALLVVMTIFFALEILQFRSSVPAEGRGQFDIGSWKAVAKHLVTAPVLIWMGRAAVRR